MCSLAVFSYPSSFHLSINLSESQQWGSPELWVQTSSTRSILKDILWSNHLLTLKISNPWWRGWISYLMILITLTSLFSLLRIRFLSLFSLFFFNIILQINKLWCCCFCFVSAKGYWWLLLPECWEYFFFLWRYNFLYYYYLFVFFLETKFLGFWLRS